MVSLPAKWRRWAHPSLLPMEGLAMEGQPQSQFYFHRPLFVLLGAFLNAGFYLDGMGEPVFPDQSNAGIFQKAFSQIPAAWVVRLRTCQVG